MSDPKNQEKQVELDDLELQKETVQDLAADVRGGLAGRTNTGCADMNLPTGIMCPHVTDTCGKFMDAENQYDNQDNLP